MSAAAQGKKNFKVCLIGSSSVGKTSLVVRYSKGSFSPGQEATIGAAFVSRDIQTKKGTVSLQIWDTAGQERYRSLVPKYSQGASAIIIVFDVTDENSFYDAQEWLNEARTNHGGKVIWYLVANKIDLNPEFDLEKARNYAESEKINYIETSAATGFNVNELFLSIAEQIPTLPPTPNGIDVSKTSATPKKNCC